MGSNDFKQASDCHQKCFKSIYDTSMNNAKEIVNITYETSAKVLEVVNKNISENVHQASSNMQNMADQAQKNVLKKSLLRDIVIPRLDRGILWYRPCDKRYRDQVCGIILSIPRFSLSQFCR